MINLDELADKDLQNIGEMVLNELNINLFNAEPTIHKAYQIYVELVHAGYKESNKQLACEKIKKYFTSRTLRNHRKEFQVFFGIPFSDEMRPILTLSFRTCEIDPEIIKKIGHKTNKILYGLEFFKNSQIPETVIIQAITELFNPQYHENEWRITIPALFGKIKKNLIARGEGQLIDLLEELFYKIDPNPKKKKLRGLKLVKGSNYLDVTEVNLQAHTTHARVDVMPLSLVGAIGSLGVFDETLQSRANVIKESEIEYVKTIVELINSDEVQERLSVDLYQSDKRHPMISNFLNSVKSYNRIMGDKDMKLNDALSELKVVVRGLREMGREVERMQQKIVGERVEKLHFEIKKGLEH